MRAASLCGDHTSEIELDYDVRRSIDAITPRRTGTVSEMKELELIRESVTRRGITRLCHFSPSRNLAHILSGRGGIISASSLRDDDLAVYNPTDKARLDGRSDHVCCSIQYPNAWYFSKARLKEMLFDDWVVLMIDAKYLWQHGTKFSPGNAATKGGALIAEGVAGFVRLFAENVDRFYRGPRHPPFVPTDEQAEVLISGHIAIKDIIGVGVKDRGQADREVVRLRLQGLEIPRLRIVSEFFNASVLSGMLRSGSIPEEHEYDPGGAYG